MSNENGPQAESVSPTIPVAETVATKRPSKRKLLTIGVVAVVVVAGCTLGGIGVATQVAHAQAVQSGQSALTDLERAAKDNKQTRERLEKALAAHLKDDAA